MAVFPIGLALLPVFSPVFCFQNMEPHIQVGFCSGKNAKTKKESENSKNQKFKNRKKRKNQEKIWKFKNSKAAKNAKTKKKYENPKTAKKAKTKESSENTKIQKPQQTQKTRKLQALLEHIHACTHTYIIYLYIRKYIHIYIFTYLHIHIYILQQFKGIPAKAADGLKTVKQSRSSKSSKVAGTFTPYTCTHTHTQICILIGVHTHIYIYTHARTLQQFKRIQATAEGARWRNQTFTQVAASGCSWLSLGTSGRLLMLGS